MKKGHKQCKDCLAYYDVHHTCDGLSNGTWEERLGQLCSLAWKNGLWHSEATFSKDIKDFILSERTSMIGEVEKMKEKLPIGKCLNAENHMFGSCFQCEKIKGNNAALDQVINYLKNK